MNGQIQKQIQNQRAMRVRALRVQELSPALVDEMWELYHSGYDHVSREKFESDLAAKNLVFVGTDRATGRLAGFSTADLRTETFAGRRAGVLFSGDTMFRPEYWGQRGLHVAFLAEVVKWKLRHPLTPLYWNLIASGCRTYLIMARNYRDYFPHPERETPAFEAGLLDSVMSRRFGSAWNPCTGLVDFARPEAVLRQELAPFTREVLELPEIRFFVRRNPEHARGVELATLARFNLAFLTRMVSKHVLRPLRPSKKAPRPAAKPELSHA